MASNAESVSIWWRHHAFYPEPGSTGLLFHEVRLFWVIYMFGSDFRQSKQLPLPDGVSDVDIVVLNLHFENDLS